MIDLLFADLPSGVRSRVHQSHVLWIWEQLLEHCEAIGPYSTKLHLDIVFSEVPYRQYIRRNPPPEDWFDRIEEAYERGTLVKSRINSRRTKWIVVCGEVSNMIPDFDNPVDYAYFGLDVIGALAVLEGGVYFNTREGRIISVHQWDEAEEYFLKLLNEYRLVPQSDL